MKVAECMTGEVRFASPDDTIQQAAQAMAAGDIGMLPVGEGERLVGAITDRDIAIRAVGDGKGCDAKVRDVMSAEVLYCYDDQEVDEVLANMGDQQVRRLPVLNRDKRLVGILSLADCSDGDAAAQAGQTLHEIARPGGQHSQAQH